MRRQGPLRLALAGALTAIVMAIGAGAAQADPPPPGSSWHEAYITEPDGTKLHADVLRPEGLNDSDRTPVILSIGPYFNHSGQTGPAGPVEDTPFDPTAPAGPSGRFFDFVNGAHLMQRGYTYVMVDLRGFGGSSGCLGWAGPGEQADVKAAVEWAAEQPWSTGKVGIYGKSYDGVTGLIGTAVKPAGLAAVVSQEPVYDLYRYLYANRVRCVNSLATPALYDMIAETPGSVQDSPDYNSNGANDLQRPGCPGLNYADQQDRDHDSAYWRQRDLIAKAKGSTVPLFMTQGFLEDNTKPDGAYEFFNNMAGPKRAWFGMWDHVRGNDADDNGRLKMGRAGWFDETMRFYDQYLKGEAPAVQDPIIAVETSDGSWRAEDAWPPKDAQTVDASLRQGTYTDDATNNGTAEGGSPNGEGIWTISPPLKDDVHLAGVPKVTADVGALAQDANLAVDVYDIDQDRNAALISRGTSLLPNSGTVGFELYGDDWKLPAGHRLGVLLASSNSEWWAQGDPSVKLESYKSDAPFQLDVQTISEGEQNAFPLPPAQHACG
jgi:predicted acyl esterase